MKTQQELQADIAHQRMLLSRTNSITEQVAIAQRIMALERQLSQVTPSSNGLVSLANLFNKISLPLSTIKEQ